MPVFTLKKYEPTAPTTKTDNPAVKDESGVTKKEELTIQVEATDTVALLVARALYKSMPNVEVISTTTNEEAGDTTPQTQVVTTETINESPVEALESVRNKSSVVIINKGFKTAKEEWFLSSMESMNIKVYYSIESFLKSKSLGN